MKIALFLYITDKNYMMAVQRADTVAFYKFNEQI